MENEKNEGDTPQSKPTIFWIMQFTKNFEDVYKKFKKKLGDEYNIECSKDDKNQVNLLEKIIPKIIAADFIIADVSTIEYDSTNNNKPLHNGNVMFEVGVAMSYRKNIILITASEEKEVPFDFGSYQLNRYKNNEKEEIETFVQDIKDILSNKKTKYKNPVSDFDKKYDIVLKSELEQLRNVAASLPEPTVQEIASPEPPGNISLLSFDELFEEIIKTSLILLTNAVNHREVIEIDKSNGDFFLRDAKNIFTELQNISVEETETAINFLIDQQLINKQKTSYSEGLYNPKDIFKPNQRGRAFIKYINEKSEKNREETIDSELIKDIPQDILELITWIFYNDKQKQLCLLNIPHKYYDHKRLCLSDFHDIKTFFDVNGQAPLYTNNIEKFNQDLENAQQKFFCLKEQELITLSPTGRRNDGAEIYQLTEKAQKIAASQPNIWEKQIFQF